MKPNLLEPLIASVREWADYLEEACMIYGRPLDDRLQRKAHSAGVAHPERIRLMAVPKIPLPENPLLQLVAREQGLSLHDISGITFGYAIIICEKRAFDESLITHEAVHVGQYERLGKERFLRKYISDCLLYGYEESPLEKEAVAIAAEISS